MTPDHLAALLASAEAKKDEKGWSKVPNGRLITLYAASNGVGLTVSRVEATRLKDGIVELRTVKNELFLVALADVYAGAIEAPPAAGGRKAGFI